MTAKEARGTLRGLKRTAKETGRMSDSYKFMKNGKTALQVKFITTGYAVCEGEYDPCVYTGYDQWSYGWSESMVLDSLKRLGAIAG